MKPLTVIGICLMLFSLGFSYYAGYVYSKDVSYAWDLADRASTIQQKQKYLEEFTANLQREGLAQHNALIFKTPENNCENNVAALSSLNERLEEIKDLDPESFAYQTAIQQITEQEQGEADTLTSHLQGCWTLHNYPLAWRWINTVILAFGLVFMMGTLKNFL